MHSFQKDKYLKKKKIKNLVLWEQAKSMTVCKNAPFNLILISKIPLKQIEYFNLLEKAKLFLEWFYMRKEVGRR